MSVLQRLFLLEHLPAWRTNRLKRIVKAPKLHMVDCGLACSLLGIQPRGLLKDRELLGQMLETFVYQEIRRQADALGEPYSLFHYRDRDGSEVDIVIGHGSLAVAGIDIKASATAKGAHFRGLRKLRKACGKRFVAGVVLYDGEYCTSFGNLMFAVPIRLLWEHSD